MAGSQPGVENGVGMGTDTHTHTRYNHNMKQLRQKTRRVKHACDKIKFTFHHGMLGVGVVFCL